MRLYTPTNQGQKTNQINFFFAFIIRALKKLECGTRDGGRVEGEGRGGEGGNKMCDV